MSSNNKALPKPGPKPCLNDSDDESSVVDLVAIARDIEVAQKKQQDNVSAEEETSKRQKQKNYTPVEDLLVCQAYISTSEDPIVGNKTKGPLFQKKLAECYAILLDEQIRKDTMRVKHQNEVIQKASPKTPLVQLRPGTLVYGWLVDWRLICIVCIVVL